MKKIILKLKMQVIIIIWVESSKIRIEKTTFRRSKQPQLEFKQANIIDHKFPNLFEINALNLICILFYLSII